MTESELNYSQNHGSQNIKGQGEIKLMMIINTTKQKTTPDMNNTNHVIQLTIPLYSSSFTMLYQVTTKPPVNKMTWKNNIAPFHAIIIMLLQ
jgi:hypothetical protein